jgi:hypothetical protein
MAGLLVREVEEGVVLARVVARGGPREAGRGHRLHVGVPRDASSVELGAEVGAPIGPIAGIGGAALRRATFEGEIVRIGRVGDAVGAREARVGRSQRAEVRIR